MLETIYSRLSRVTTTGRLIPEIDALRFIAITLVVLYHIHDYIAFRTGFPLDKYHAVVGAGFNPLTHVISHGSIGVPLFFVLSGFVLGLPFAAHALSGRPPVRLRSYFYRRITRLEVPYLLAVLFSFLIGYAFIRDDAFRKLLPASALASTVYSHGLIYGELPRVNLVFWSLEVEVQFYILAPLLASVFLIRRRLLRRAIVVAAIVTLGIAQPHLYAVWRLPFTIVCYLHYFLAGFLLCDVYVDDWKQAPPTLRWAPPALVVGWPLLFLLVDHRLAPYREAVLPLVITVLYAASLGKSRFTPLLSWRPIVTIGGMCYSIYLTHQIVIFAVGRVSQRIGPVGPYTTTFLVHAVPMLMGVALAGILFFVLIERPCMQHDWPSRLRARVVRALGKPDLAAQPGIDGLTATPSTSKDIG